MQISIIIRVSSKKSKVSLKYQDTDYYDEVLSSDFSRHNAHAKVTFIGAIALRTFHESAGTITRESAIVERSWISEVKKFIRKSANIFSDKNAWDPFRLFDVIARSRITKIFRIALTIAPCRFYTTTDGSRVPRGPKSRNLFIPSRFILSLVRFFWLC